MRTFSSVRATTSLASCSLIFSIFNSSATSFWHAFCITARERTVGSCRNVRTREVYTLSFHRPQVCGQTSESSRMFSALTLVSSHSGGLGSANPERSDGGDPLRKRLVKQHPLRLRTWCGGSTFLCVQHPWRYRHTRRVLYYVVLW